MQLVSFEVSRLTALFVFGPQGIYYPAALGGLVKRYGFVGYPSPGDTLQAVNGVEFKHGLFEGVAIESLQIYRDGVIISAKASTDVHDKILKDLMSWLIEDLGGSIIQNHTQDRMYESCLIFEPSKDILVILNAFKKVQDKLSDMVKKNSNLKANFEAFGFGFAPDQNLIPGIKPSGFQIERWTSADYSMTRFFSRAPVKTDQHIELISMIESLL